MSRAVDKDKIIQNLLERGVKQVPAEIDAAQWEAYEILFKALDQKPEGGLPYKFSAGVISEIQQRAVQKERLRSNLLVPLLIFIGITLSYFILSAINSEYSDRLISYMANYKWFIVFGTSFYMLVEFLDFKLVKRNLH